MVILILLGQNTLQRIYRGNILKKITIYAKGESNTEKKVSMWACILSFENLTKELSGYMPNSNPDRMELMAIISGIGALKEPCEIEVFLSGEYVFQAIHSGNLLKWLNTDWKDEHNKRVPNEDLWRMLIIQHRVKKHTIKYKHDKNKNNPFFIRCDELMQKSKEEFLQKNADFE